MFSQWLWKNPICKEAKPVGYLPLCQGRTTTNLVSAAIIEIRGVLLTCCLLNVDVIERGTPSMRGALPVMEAALFPH